MNRGLSILFVAASLIVLAGCTISGDGGGQVDAPDRQVSNDPFAAVASGSLSAGDWQDYELHLTSSQVAQQAIYFELEENLDLYVYNSNGNLYATSSGPNFFALGTSGLSAANAGAEPLALDTQLTCRGSCVIRDAADSRYFVRIRNTTGSTQNYTLYSYVDSYEDLGEFVNDVQAGAVDIQMGTTEEGAIESIADQDFYEPVADGWIRFDTSASVNVVAEIIDPGVERISLVPGDSVPIFGDEYVEVWVEGDDEAAVSSKSLYFLTLTNTEQDL